MGEFLMPSLGADMEAGILVEWLKRPGDRIKRGEIVAVVETDKGAIEIEVFEDGVIERLLVEPGKKVPVGTPLAMLAGGGEPAPVKPPAPAPAQPAAEPARPSVVVALPVTGRQRVSPAARRLAAERGIDLAGLAGTGPAGAIISTDLPAARPAARPAGGPDLAAMRRAIAAAMARSKREIPHYYLSHAIDMTRAGSWLEQANAERPPAQRLLIQVPLLKAVALALRQHAQFNGFFTNSEFRPSERIHIGTAIAVRGGGLIAPAIHDVDRLSIDELMAKLRDLVRRARTGSLRSSELSDPTVTVSSLGERGVDALYGVIYPPQVAILGFGAPSPRPWVVETRVEPRPVVTASLAADHRVSDGHFGSLLLADIDRLLQQPEKL